MVPEVGLPRFGAVVRPLLLEGQGEVAFEAEVEAEVEDFLSYSPLTVFIVLKISRSRLLTTVPNYRYPIPAIWYIPECVGGNGVCT
jgi:hypothetical protein